MKEEKEKQEEKILTKLQEDFKQEIEKYENKRKVDQIGKKKQKEKSKKEKNGEYETNDKEEDIKFQSEIYQRL